MGKPGVELNQSSKLGRASNQPSRSASVAAAATGAAAPSAAAAAAAAGTPRKKASRGARKAGPDSGLTSTRSHLPPAAPAGTSDSTGIPAQLAARAAAGAGSAAAKDADAAAALHSRENAEPADGGDAVVGGGRGGRGRGSRGGRGVRGGRGGRGGRGRILPVPVAGRGLKRKRVGGLVGVRSGSLPTSVPLSVLMEAAAMHPPAQGPAAAPAALAAPAAPAAAPADAAQPHASTLIEQASTPREHTGSPKGQAGTPQGQAGMLSQRQRTVRPARSASEGVVAAGAAGVSAQSPAADERPKKIQRTGGATPGSTAVRRLSGAAAAKHFAKQRKLAAAEAAAKEQLQQQQQMQQLQRLALDLPQLPGSSALADLGVVNNALLTLADALNLPDDVLAQLPAQIVGSISSLAARTGDMPGAVAAAAVDAAADNTIPGAVQLHAAVQDWYKHLAAAVAEKDSSRVQQLVRQLGHEVLLVAH